MTEARKKEHPHPTMVRTFSMAAGYVLSGCTQPLLVALLKDAGLTDPRCQLHMLFNYAMPSLFTLPLVLMDRRRSSWPSRRTVLKACGIATWDVLSTTLNYTGASMAGPTIFAIIYSSVTVWTAVFSKILLGRVLSGWQWITIVTVVAGLAITAVDSASMGSNVFLGACLINLGSVMHGFTYVMSESVMTTAGDSLTVVQNTFVQMSVCAGLFLVWQLVYTLPHFDDGIVDPARDAGTTLGRATVLLLGFGFANAVHAVTFYHTLCHFPGGATSTAVGKGLQAVLVFVFTSLLYCGRIGGPEMCFTTSKLASLVTVCGGVLGYGRATQAAAAAAAASNDRTGRFDDDDETTPLVPTACSVLVSERWYSRDLEPR